MYIHENQHNVSVHHACKCLGVNRSGYYNWFEEMTSPDIVDSFEMELKDEIQRIVLEFMGYGYRRVTHELHRRGFHVNSKRVRRLMAEDNLLCFRKKKFVPMTTDSDHTFRVYPNLARSMKVTGLNQLWVADITYVHLLQDFIYLSVIIDVFSRKCIGWDLDRTIDTQLTLNALKKAIQDRLSMSHNGLVHHSDQGVQYASYAYINYLKDHDIRISMSRKGNPYDNAFAESFIKTLKYEEVYLTEYRTFCEAYGNIERFIDEVYNEKRLHSSIGYMPPNEFEMEVNNYKVA
jgi:transposase InsO family protein